MATFTYVGKTKQGAVRKGDLTAKTREEAAEQLRRQNVIVSSLLEVKAPEGILQRLSLGGGVGDKEVAVFTRQFATMINAGLPLVQCLEILSTQTENKIFAKAIAEIKFDVEAGSTFADALKKHPKIFDELYVNLVNAGKVGVLLDTILDLLPKNMEKAMKRKTKTKTALANPAA